jgi:RHS repeat-associated protein
MQLASGTHIPDGLLAANALLSEKLHRGFAAPKSTLHQGFGVAISSTALGIPGTLYDGRIGCRYTGKDRDAETGLDYFGARYYSSNFGRFMTPDWAATPTDVPYAQFGDPQSLNLYGYVRNNPNTGVDADGHVVSMENGALADQKEEEQADSNATPPPASSSASGATPAKPAPPNNKTPKDPAQQQQTESKATVGERVELGAEATANVIVGLPKAAGGAAALVVGVLGSETGVGLGVAATGGYELVQGSGQLTSALYQGGAAVTGKSKGVDEAVDEITVHTSIVAYGASKLNGGNIHAAAKYGALEGIVTGGIKGELFKGVRNTIDTLMSFKDWVTK